LINGIACLTVAVQPSIDLLKLRKAQDPNRVIGWPLRKVTDKSGDRCGYTSDGADPTGYLLDVNAWIGERWGHDVKIE
jgi:hypothetical protein